jgi:hypothetical protein
MGYLTMGIYWGDCNQVATWGFTMSKQHMAGVPVVTFYGATTW